MRVRCGDKLLFERIDASSKDNLLSLNDDLYISEILLVSERDLYSEDEMCQHKWFMVSCLCGLKVKGIINRSHRNLIHGEIKIQMH